ncbi:glycosyltransferase family 2 protein [Galbibacter sp. BG1]|uniref:glycosyltransferase family 2 protein n=1 Tax=Galbibacter sp. BG1 TaxID=1170699 RepID=UPI0015B8B0CE|nr:glycosyltransferase family A protein [Galbibacter sp. BG1]QLE02796.1 glycosyltransferase family 2 protein [Galbibacter sp. BG1]
MKTDKISIIVPIYNSEAFLRRCFDSILEQTYTNYEVLLIDDGSTDTSKEICEEYLIKDKRFTYFFKTNGGLSSARNYGIKKANGSFIFFLDSDDFIVNNALTICHATATNNNLELLNFGYQYHKNGHISPFYSSLPKGRIIDHFEILEILKEDTLGNRLLWFSWSYFYKTSFLKENNLLFNEKVLLGEDSDFNLRCLLTCRGVYSIEAPLYCYVYNPNSLTQTNYKSNLLEKYSSQFNARLNVYNDFKLNDDAYKKDISRNYIEHALFELIHNEKNNNENTKLSAFLAKIRATPMFEFCAKHYSFSTNCPPKKKLFSQFFVWKQTKLLSLLIKSV